MSSVCFDFFIDFASFLKYLHFVHIYQLLTQRFEPPLSAFAQAFFAILRSASPHFCLSRKISNIFDNPLDNPIFL